MISPTKFKRQWNEYERIGSSPDETLQVYTPASLAGVDIPEVSKQFLLDAGLPGSAAPFLSFGYKRDNPFPDVATIWRLDERYKIYREIGRTGSDDSICLEEGTGRVVFINHDHYFEIILFNSSIPQLAESLLTFRSYIHQAQQRNGSDAYIKNNIPQDLKEWLAVELRRIDTAVVQGNSFWWKAN